MTTDTQELQAPGRGLKLPEVLRLALRELRGGIKGFYIFTACVALGVAVITSVGAITDALQVSLARQGEILLGGDLRLSRAHRPVTAKERAWLLARGDLSEMAVLRTMARRPDLAEQTLVEVKGVDGAYPLAGAMKVRRAGGGGLSSDMSGVSKAGGAYVDPILLERLNLKLGDGLKIGKSIIPIKGVIDKEPDKLTSRLSYGPRVMLSIATLKQTGLLRPGALVRWRYSWKLKNGRGATAAGLDAMRRALKAGPLKHSGFGIRDRRKPSPFVTRTIERLGQFLTLIGLTALLVGGVGVANAVNSFIDRRRKIIATYKSLGACGRLIFQVHLMQVTAIAGLGVIIGLAFGYLVPGALNSAFGAALPFKLQIAVTARSALTACGYGLLVALVFTLWPLGRAEMVRASVLFRDEVAAQRVWPRAYVMVLTAMAAAALVGFAVGTSQSSDIALYFCAGLAVLFGVFLVLAMLVAWVARRLPRPRIPEIALALGNLGAPGGLTRQVVLSLGAGLSLLVAIALVDNSLVEELLSRAPVNAPNYFVLDVAEQDYSGFSRLVSHEIAQAIVKSAPMLRGRLIKLGGRPVETIKAPPDAQWVLNGDRGLSYDDNVPDGSKVVKGKWWPKNYDGEPLVSFEAELAHKLGVGIGDTVTVNVLGRDVSARIANLRKVNWESLAINFVMVFSPNTLRAAPHRLIATISLPKDTTLKAEAQLARKIGRAFPAVTPIRVKDAINRFNEIFTKIMGAVRMASAVTLLAGALVLAGALSTAQRRRISQAVILKTLGATRRRILLSHFTEYLILASVTAVIAIGLGSIAAWLVLVNVMDVQFVFSGRAVLQALLLSIGLVLLFGGLGTWRVLKAPTVPYLRRQ